MLCTAGVTDLRLSSIIHAALIVDTHSRSQRFNVKRSTTKALPLASAIKDIREVLQHL